MELIETKLYYRTYFTCRIDSVATKMRHCLRVMYVNWTVKLLKRFADTAFVLFEKKIRVHKVVILVSPKCHKIGQRHFARFEIRIRIIVKYQVALWSRVELIGWESFIISFFEHHSTPTFTLTEIKNEFSYELGFEEEFEEEFDNEDSYAYELEDIEP